MLGLSLPRTAGLDWHGALESEIQWRSPLLPSRIIELSVADSVGEVAAYLQAQATVGVELRRTEVITAAKSPRGFRPVNVLTLMQRTLYAALVRALTPPIEAPTRSDEAHDAFLRAPLEEAPVFVVRADVSAFYQYIDHRLLEEELVARTGMADVPRAISELLNVIMGRRVGLPQNNASSHLLADVFIDKVERRLARLGHHVWRYNDDFLIATASPRASSRALEDLDRLLRETGLTLNDDKSYPIPSDKYLAWITRAEERRTQLSSDLGVDLDDWMFLPSGYEGDEAEDELDATVPSSDAQVDGAVRTLQLWWNYLSGEAVHDPQELYVNRKLARDAVRVLRRRGSEKGIVYCFPLITREPHLTHTVARYLASLSAIGSDAPQAWLSSVVQQADAPLSEWQKLWLLEPLRLSHALQPDLWPWVAALTTGDHPDVIRSHAAFVLAKHGKVGLSDVGTLYESLGEAARPEVVGAMALLSPPENAAMKSMTNENLVARKVAEFIGARRSG